ncbi:MAG: hypothetical protein JWN56_1444 [Sphingobacteriales bacterium]|nr:hypothetical protein [Sphingobacteriales bacterium]
MKRVTVPLELINLNNDGFHLLVEVFVFNEIFNLVLDTGASKTVLDKFIVEKYTNVEDLLISDQLSTGLGTNSMQSYGIRLDNLKFGKLIMNQFEVAVLDLSIISAAYENLNLPPIIGVLGGDILQKHEAVIDYKKLHLKLNILTNL